jgi:hypothetical protein
VLTASGQTSDHKSCCSGSSWRSRKISIGAYPAAPTSSYAGLTETARSHDPAAETLQQATYSVTLTPGQQIHLDLRVYAGASPASVQLRWVPPDDQTQSINAAVAAANSAHKVIVFAYDEGTEGRDRGGSDQAAGLQLPGYQDALSRPDSTGSFPVGTVSFRRARWAPRTCAPAPPATGPPARPG